MEKEDKVTSEEIMSDKVKTALLSGMMKLPNGKKLKCDIALREFTFKKGRYDVVGYNKRKNTIYIIECKLGTNIISIGQAFGQVLAYKSILIERGYEFLERFYDRYFADVAKTKGHIKIKLEDWRKIIDRRKMNFRFFIALKEQVRNLYKEILSIKDDMNFKIGVLIVTKEGICTPRFGINKEIDNKLAENDKIEIPLIKKYTKVSFLENIEEKLKEKLGNKYKFKSHSDNYTTQFKLFPGTHYEVWITKKHIEIALHIETYKNKTEKIFSFLKLRENQIKSSLGKHVKIEKWGKGWETGKGIYWARVYERLPRKVFDENLLNEIVRKMEKYIEVLQPLLEQIEK